eukprot:14538106-Ditylum_brightwellii.AAC.1
MGWWRFLVFFNLSGKSESMDLRLLMQQCFCLAGFIFVNGCFDLVGVGGANGLNGKADYDVHKLLPSEASSTP